MALDIDYSFLTRKDFSQAGRKLQQVTAFPVGTVGGHCFCSSRAGLLHHRILYLDNNSAQI